MQRATLSRPDIGDCPRNWLSVFVSTYSDWIDRSKTHLVNIPLGCSREVEHFNRRVRRDFGYKLRTTNKVEKGSAFILDVKIESHLR